LNNLRLYLTLHHRVVEMRGIDLAGHKLLLLLGLPLHLLSHLARCLAHQIVGLLLLRDLLRHHFLPLRLSLLRRRCGRG
jgi:hypothetical protein